MDKPVERSDFLNSVWSPYPVLSDLVPLSEALDQRRSGVCRVGGRLRRREEQWCLADQQTEIALDSYAASLATIDGLPEFQRSWFRDGDVVAMNFDLESGRRSPLVLLAPCRVDSPSLSFGFEESRGWMSFTSEVRQFFSSRGFIELSTPTLVVCPGTEAYLDPFEVAFEWSGQQYNYFLPTSPEIHLKKALSLGWDRVFEVAKCYRNSEISAIHQPEFWMLEWYRGFQDLSAIQRDVVDLWRSLYREAFEVKRCTFVQLFKEYLGVELTPTTTDVDLRRWIESEDLHQHASDSWSDLFFRLFVEKIEPRLTLSSTLIFLEQFPPQLSAFARLDREGWAERFEVFWQGIELGNAFHEVNDPDENLRRQVRDLQAKSTAGRKPIGLDPEFQLAMQRGVPPTAGIAMGLDRMFMCLAGLNELKLTRLFPLSLPER